MKEPLFRQEALQFSTQQSLGNVPIFQPVTLRVLSLLLLIITAVAGAYLWFGEYARKQTIYGYLEPEKGIVSVFSGERRAVVRSILVQSGEYVPQGQPLAQLGFPNNIPGDTDTLVEILNELKTKRIQFQMQLRRHGEYYKTQEIHLVSRISDIENELEKQDLLIQLQNERVSVETRLLESMEGLRISKAVAETTYFQVVAGKIEQDKELIAIEQRVVQLNSVKSEATVSLLESLLNA